MENKGKTILWSAAEVAEFHPIWETLAEIGGFRDETERMRDLLLLADEEGLMNGTSPLLPDIKRYEQTFAKLVTSVGHSWDRDKLRKFRFYCLYHDGRNAEFDVQGAARSALERKNREWLDRRECNPTIPHSAGYGPAPYPNVIPACAGMTGE